MRVLAQSNDTEMIACFHSAELTSQPADSSLGSDT